MSIELKCVQCGATHRVNNRMAGRRVRCPSCSTAIHVPEELVDESESDDTKTIGSDSVAIAIIPEAEESIDDGFGGQSDRVTPEPARDPSLAPAEAEAEADAEAEDDDVMPARRKREEEELDMTPMVDVTFLLLIFFMVTASFSLQKSIEMPRQQTDAPSTSTTDEDPEELDLVELQVDEFGSFLVLAADWEKETPGKQNLISALKESMTAGADGMRLAIRVHELAKLQALVDAMDAGTIAGFTQIEVTQVEEFD